MKEKRKLNLKRVIGIIEIIILVILIATIGIKVYNDFFKKEKEEAPTNVIVEKNRIKNYSYKLEDRDTDIYTTYFNELKKTLESDEIDYEKYADLLSKLFIIDFYTLSNKLTSTDIGSLDFIHPNNLENFKLNAGNTMYKSILSNLYNERTQALPEVKDVTINNINPTKFNYNAVEYDAYEISASWTYVTDMGYDTAKTLILIKDDSKLYVVSSK